MSVRLFAVGAVAALCCVMAAGVAQAGPTLEAEIFDNGTMVGSLQTSSIGLLQFTTSDALFSSIQLTADGVPVVTSPDLVSQTTKVSTASGFTGTHTLVIDVTQLGLTGFTGAMSFASAFTANFLIGASEVSADSLGNYYDANNTAFATTTLLGAASCTASGCITSPASTTIPSVSGDFSETEVFSATFISGGATLQSNSQLTGSAVPEPASLGLLGMGLVGLGMLRLRRRA